MLISIASPIWASAPPISMSLSRRLPTGRWVAVARVVWPECPAGDGPVKDRPCPTGDRSFIHFPPVDELESSHASFWHLDCWLTRLRPSSDSESARTLAEIPA